MFSPFTIIITLLTTCRGEFIAYDCTGPRLNTTSFNTLSVDFCSTPTPIKSIKISNIKLIQKSEIQTQQYKSCYITVEYLITRCSAMDDAQVVEGGYRTDLIELGHTRCATLHEKSIYEIPSGGIINNIQINQTTLSQRVISGTIDREGNCEGTTFRLGSETWHKVIVQAKYKIQLSEGTAIANYNENTLILPTGTRFKLTDSYGIDTHKGEVIWATNKHKCDDDEYDLLYEGPASLIISKADNDNDVEKHVYLVETDKIAFALRKVRKTFACDVPVLQTEHPQLFIVTEETYFHRFTIKNISPFNTDLLAYINTKFVYIENILRSTATSLYADLIMKQCKLDRDILIQKLAIASYNLAEFAYTMGNGPGYTAMISGEIVYLVKCKPVEVELLKQNSCFNELPVTYNNKTYYMTPKTHTLQQYGTEITCNGILPPAFNLNGIWIGMTPDIKEIRSPQTLKPSTEWTWTYKGPEYLMSAGLYTMDTMHAFQKQIMFPQELDAAQKNLARHSMGYELTDQRIRLKPFIDQETINKLIENRLQKLWGWFVGLGNIISGLLGIIFIAKIIIICLNTGINITILYETFGWSAKLAAGIFSSFTHLLVHKQINQRNAHIQKTKDTVSTLYPNLRRISI